MSYKLGSLFDGSGGFPLAGALCGIEPVWASEVEPYPIAVTKSRFPRMKHLGDISKINGGEIEPVDIITFGSPCQDLSVAGKRAGLKHEANGDEETTRSGLFMEAVRIIKEMREKTNGEYPRFAIWENVPGAFSSNKGEDFKVVCEELIKIVEPTATMPSVPQKGWNYADSYIGDGWSLAYRVLDAQYWGVPQRRRRIYLVTDFRGQRAREILFEREGLRGYFTQGRTPWQTTPTDAQRSIRADDREGEIPYTLKIRSGVSVDSHGKAAGKGALIQENLAATLGVTQDQYLFQPNGFDRYNQCSTGEKCETLRTPGGGDNFPTVYYGVGVDPYNGDTTGDKSSTLGVNCGVSTGRNGVIAIDKESYTSDVGFNRSPGITIGGPCATLQTNGVHAVCYDARGNGDGLKSSTITGDHENRITDYTSVVLEQQPTYCLQGNGIDRADNAGCNGKGWKEDTSYTLNTIDRPAVVFAVDQGGGKSSANVTEDKAPTPCTTHGGEPAVAYSNQAYDKWEANEKGATLRATGGVYGGGSENLVQANYIVRRLTPTECARLQGFADRWGDIDAVDTLSQKDYQFWLEVRKTHDAINGREPKEYTVKQMLTWYNKLQTDSAEYKMWGNGIALPTALYVLQGIEDALFITEMLGE